MAGILKAPRKIVHIVGGGLHGCFLAIALQYELHFNSSDIKIYDPQPLLHNWLRRSSACFMSFLRSNSSQTIHVNFNSLREFARNEGIDPWDSQDFTSPYHRPSLDIFNRHALFCIDKYKLMQMHVPLRVEALLPAGGVCVAGKELPGTVIYVGCNTSLSIPSWTSRLSGAVHVFADSFYKNLVDIPTCSCIIGQGISALQLSIALAKQGKKPLLLTRRPLKVFRFDFNPCYIGRYCQEDLDLIETEAGPEQRMSVILQGRLSGTVPQELAEEFYELMETGALEHEVIADETEFILRAKKHTPLLLCTGFARQLPDPLLSHPSQKFVSGYPVLGKDLRWVDGVFISGMNAMYRIGPAAPNIIGTHLSWRIIRDQLRSSLTLG